jgi:hypothetical protein
MLVQVTGDDKEQGCRCMLMLTNNDHAEQLSMISCPTMLNNSAAFCW